MRWFDIGLGRKGMGMIDYKLYLDYFKQGDDLCHYLDKCNGNTVEALELHACALEESIRKLRGMASYIRDNKVELVFEADTHNISVDGPTEHLKKLAELKLLDVVNYGDDEDFDGDFDGLVNEEKLD